MVIEFRTKADVNGNSRRLHVRFDERGLIVAGEVENYNIPEWVWTHLNEMGGYSVPIDLAPAEWNRWRRRIDAFNAAGGD